MPSLATLAESFLLLGKAIDPGAITKVHFDFDFLPSDLPGESGWELKVTLSGTQELAQEGTETVLAFTQEVHARGTSEREVVEEAHKQLTYKIESFASLRRKELDFAEQAVMTAHSQLGELDSLWSQKDPASEAGEMGTTEGNP
jgi:hypothetical protein